MKFYTLQHWWPSLTTVQSLLLGVVVWGPQARMWAAQGPLLTFTVENDSFLSTDRHYTHGTRLAYFHTEDVMPWWVSNWVQQLPGGMEIEARRLGMTIGQNIYTPEDLNVTQLIRNDRPYAGWLYAGLLVQRRGAGLAGMISIIDNLELDLGVVGPESLAEDAQTWWHDTINATQPRGWKHQLRTEPGLVLSLDRAWRLPRPTTGFSADITPDVGLTVGNIATYASIGCEFRAGFNLPDTAAPGGIMRPSLPVPSHQQGVGPNWGCYGFIGTEGRAIARNIFLDGNTWRDSHSVDKNYLVADLEAGIAGYYGRLSLSITYVFRTREFSLQNGENEFASVALGLQF